MATYVNLDHPQVLVQLANPSGDFDCKKDLFQIQGDYALALYDEKLEFLGYSNTRQGPLDKKCFPKMKKRLFSSKVKGYLLFLRKDHVKGLAEKDFPELVVKPDSKTIKSTDGNVPYEGTVRLNAGIIANGIGKMCKAMDFLKGDGKANICLSVSNLNAICEAALGVVFKQETFDFVDGVSPTQTFKFDPVWRNRKHLRLHLDQAIKIAIERSFPGAFQVTVAKTEANTK